MSTTTGPSVSSILGSMTGVTVTNGWDVISAVSADALNDFLIGQFAYNMGQDLTLGPYSGEVQIINNSYVVFENLVLGSPLIQISAGLTNPNDVKLAIPFLGGTVSVVNYLGEVGDQKLVMVTSSQFISPGSGYTLTAVVPLINFQGVVAPGTDSGQVQINFAGGSGFSANVGVSGAAQTTLGAYLAELVAQDWTQSSYVLGTLIYDAGTNLVPVMFELATQISNLEGDTGRLLLFIATNYNPGGGSQELLTISNPIPEGYTTALIVSSQVLFENLIQPSIASQLNSYGVTVTASQQTAAQNLGAWQLTGGKSANVGPATVDVESADPTTYGPATKAPTKAARRRARRTCRFLCPRSAWSLAATAAFLW